MPPRLSRKQIMLANDLVMAGVPGKVASIVAAAVHDSKNLDPALGTPDASKRDLLERISGWLAKRSGKDDVNREELSELLDLTYGKQRPDHFALLGI